MPAIVEADDLGTYVLKFRGAGQGPKALVAELIAGEVGRLLGLRIPEIVFVELDPELARTEPDPEIQDLIRASGGLNLALDYLPGSVTFDPVVDSVDPMQASAIVWFDALMTNVDRTARNTNMLMWHSELWLIDHGAALHFHHSWDHFMERSRDRFPFIENHVLLRDASNLEASGEELASRLSADVIEDIVGLIPEEWLVTRTPFDSPAVNRQAYVDYLMRRLEPPYDFVLEAAHARTMHV